MGLFDKLFNNKKDETPETNGAESEENSEESGYTQEFDFYFTNVDDKIGSMFVDLGIYSYAPVNDRPNLVWISLKLNTPNEDGLTTSEESNFLYDLEDKLEQELGEKHNGIFVGRLTSNGKRDYYYYLENPMLYDKTISEVMVEYPSYTFDYGNKIDAEWNTYFNLLYPSDREMQCLTNRRVVDNLEKNGDPLTKERQVDHWIYFNNNSDRENYINRILQENFKVESSEIDTDSENEQYTLQISRIDNVDLDNVNEYVLFLWELANENNARYDGWETSIEKDE
jgi:uncharacterized protein (TIGR01619 family)